ncbi:4151_t:CDS:2, partial [Scutellospora calospora]
NGKWPKYSVDPDKNRRCYSCEETIKKALHHIMHSRVAIINAAPVTSEVLLITKAVQLLSEPLKQRRSAAPTIIITKSSQTLDKILVELLPKFPNLIRVGSSKQCKNRSLAGRQINNLDNEINISYNQQIDHLKDTRIDLLIKSKERFTFMSDDYFLKSAPKKFRMQLSILNGKKPNYEPRDNELLKALCIWLSGDPPPKSGLKRSKELSGFSFEEFTIPRPFKFSLEKKSIKEILSANIENPFDDSSAHIYSKFSLPLMFSLIEELETTLSFDEDSNDPDNIYSSNIKELQFVNKLIDRLPQDQKHLFNKKNRFPNDLENDINQFWYHVTEDIWSIPTNERKRYRHMFNRIISNYYDPIISKTYTHAIKSSNSKMDEIRLQKLSKFMKDAPVIGFSLKNAKCLKKLFHDSSSPASAPVFIVDEASEIPENEISCIIHEDLEHLIMIGDINRSCGNSLFERWILNGGKHYRISEQSRVHPQINYLLSAFYKRIADDLVFLKNNLSILGTTSNVYFFNHQNYDQNSDDVRNTIEAEFVVKFAFYLYQQATDFDPGNITILTPFIAQKELIKSLLAPELTKEKTVKIREIVTKEIGIHNDDTELTQKIIITEKRLGRINVQLINDYRYEENQIVILSLVAVPQRLQKEALATLSSKDLVYTALSRANRGLYIFGDGDVLKKNIPIWDAIIEKTMDENIYGTELILRCQNHGIQTKISHPNHFKQYTPLGGCMMPCKKMLLCDHQCPRTCHPIPHSQEQD